MTPAQATLDQSVSFTLSDPGNMPSFWNRTGGLVWYSEFVCVTRAASFFEPPGGALSALLALLSLAAAAPLLSRPHQLEQPIYGVAPRVLQGRYALASRRMLRLYFPPDGMA